MKKRVRRSDRFGENVTPRPEILQKPAGYYNRWESRIPETLRVSFSDGTTAVYDLRIQQPKPALFRSGDQVVGYQFGGVKK